MWKKVVQKYKSQLFNVLGCKKMWSPGSTLDESIQGQKAITVLNGKPTLGTILKVFPAVSKQPPHTIKLCVSLLTLDNREITFKAKEKLQNREFYLISPEFYYELAKERNLETFCKEIKFPSCNYAKTTEVNAYAQLAAVRPGDLVETMILSGRHIGTWIRAEVQDVEENTMNLKPSRPEKWKVARLAVQVPKKFIRCISLENKKNYTVPVWFVADNKVHYVTCSKEMTVNDLKQHSSNLRGIELNQLVLISRGFVLPEGEPVPDDMIFGIICQKGGLTYNQRRLLANKGTKLKQQRRSTDCN